LPPSCWSRFKQQAPSLHGHYSVFALCGAPPHPLAFHLFLGSPLYGFLCFRPFHAGTRRLLQFAHMSLSPSVPTTPPECMSHRSVAPCHAAVAPKRVSASDLKFVRGHLWFNFRYGPVDLRTTLKEGFVGRASSLCYHSADATQLRGFLTLTCNVGLPPTDHSVLLDHTSSPNAMRTENRAIPCRDCCPLQVYSFTLSAKILSRRNSPRCPCIY